MEKGIKGVKEYLHSLLGSNNFKQLIVYHHIKEKRKADYDKNRRKWPSIIEQLLIENNISKLYSHQVHATDLIRSGKSVISTSSTSSGKSLIYFLPIIESYLKNNDATSLCLYPLKALANDQKKEMEKLLESVPRSFQPTINIYDGDTTKGERTKIRNNPPNILITNPDMLHLSMLSHHDKWISFFSSLEYIVLDEVHVYKGIFGSHICQVIRRLKRICRHYGTNPVVIMCTATISNAREVAQKIYGEEIDVVEIDGSPCGEQHYVLINPALGLESQSTITIQLLKAALHRNLQTIVYTQSRKMTELLSIWSSTNKYASQISPYRSGYLASERRDIEQKMAQGDLKAVISTNALELGINIGKLDICLLQGYPGSIISTLQRGGRVGRKNRDSLVVMIAGEDALDQYYMHNPEKLFSSKPEQIILNEKNDTILQDHIICAAAEKPIHKDEKWHEYEIQRDISNLIKQHKLVEDNESTYYYPVDYQYANKINLRSIGHSCSIKCSITKRMLGEIDLHRAYKESHLGAIYYHKSKTYIVDRFDTQKKIIYVTQAEVDYYTKPRVRKTTEILRVFTSKTYNGNIIYHGKVKVTEFITGYEKRSQYGSKLLQIIPLEIPPIEIETDSVWIQLSMSIVEKTEKQYYHFMGGIHAIEHAIIGLIPAIILVDRNDLGGISIPLHEQLGYPAIFIYEGYAGSLGYVKEAYEVFEKILEKTENHLLTCACELGCPGCIQSPKCGSGNRPLDKKSAEYILQLINTTMNKQTSLFDLDVSGKVEHKTSTDSEYLVFDLETQLSAEDVGGWNNIHKMKVSVGVVYDSRNKNYSTYHEDSIDDLISLLQSGPLVVGFNSIRFDYKVLSYYTSFNFLELHSFDILLDIYSKLNYRLSLDHIAKETLQAQKSADGLKALEWWKEGRIDLIEKYCKKDVEITKNIYQFGKQNKYILFRNKAKKQVKLPVEW